MYVDWRFDGQNSTPQRDVCVIIIVASLYQLNSPHHRWPRFLPGHVIDGSSRLISPRWSLSVTWLGDPKVIERSGPLDERRLSGILAKQKMNTPKLEVQLLLLAGHGRLQSQGPTFSSSR
ncbi:hypothetical protein CBL_04225 [Carabus blaptoides fortunei]